MIVDLHTRLWTSVDQFGPAAAAQMRRRRVDPWEDTTAAPDEHFAAMEPVDRAVIHGFESVALGGAIPHEQVASYVKRDPARFLGFGGIDPKAGDPVASLERAMDLGLVGITVNPAAAAFHPTDTAAMELFEACQNKEVPVLVEAGSLLAPEARMEFARPVLFDEVAREFPGLKLVLGDFGDPWVDEGVALIAKHPTVYADLAGLTRRPWRLFNALLTAHNLGAMGQVLFGSNFPYATPEEAIKTIYSVNTLTQGTQLPSVPREQLRSVVEADTIATLGLDTLLKEAADRALLRDATPVPDEEGTEPGDDTSGEDVPADLETQTPGEAQRQEAKP